MNDFPAAMPSPSGEYNFLTEALVSEAIQLSRESARKRIILPLHKNNQNSLHRMLN